MTSVSVGPAYRVLQRPWGLSLLADVVRSRADHLAFLERCTRLGADLVEANILTHRLFVVANADAARAVLVDDTKSFVREGNLESAGIRSFLGEGMLTTDGEAWLKWRRLNAPAFTRAAVADLQPIVEDSLERSLAELPTALGRRRLFDDFLRVAVTATTAGFLSTRPEPGEQDALVAAMLGGPEMVFAIACARTTLIRHLPLPLPRRVQRATAAVDRLLARSAARRKAEGGRARADLLDLVLQYRDPATGRPLSDAEVRDQLVTVVIAAPENIATTLSWAAYALASNPRVLATLRAELAAGDERYLRAVIDETFRRFAATPMVDRVAAVDFDLGGVRIPRGSLVVVPIAALHNHPRYWDAPGEFRPERFLGASPPSAFLPFGHGPRKCVGERLARLVLESALKRFVLGFEWSRGTDAEPGFAALINLRPADRMEMWVERRAAMERPSLAAG
jgi:cytochrome P450